MRDVARRAELISLPLRLAMIANRAEAAVSRNREQPSLDALGVAALRNVLEFIDNARSGLEITQSTSMRNYSREAISAYRISEKALAARPRDSDQGCGTSKLLETLQRGIEGFVASPQMTCCATVEQLSEFFRQLTKVCLSMDVGVVEHVARAEPRSISA